MIRLPVSTPFRGFACALPLVVMLTSPGVAHDASPGISLESLPLLTEIAPDAVAISPHVPQMGVHYAHPADLPTGPVWCVIEGRVVCVEYMFTAADLTAGRDWAGLPTGGVMAPITHIDMEYMADGVGPFAEPLYQLHVWFAAQSLLDEY